MRTVLLVWILCLIPATAMPQTKNEQLHELFDSYFEDKLRRNPELATSLGRHEYNHLWTDWSREARDEYRRKLEQYLSRLQAIPAEGLSKQDRISRELLLHEIRDYLAGEEVAVYLQRLNQLFGIHTNIYQTIREMPARTLQDYENIIARLSAVPEYVDQNIDLLEEAIEERLVQPELVIELIVKQLEAQSGQGAQETALLKQFHDPPETIPADQREELRSRARNAYEDQFLPAWKRLRDFLAKEYSQHARDRLAVTSLPGGEQIYQFLITHFTTTNLTAKEIHQLGLREVERIETEMLGIARETGFEGSLERFEEKLRNDPEQRFSSREEMLVYCRNAAKLVDPELPRFFKRLPRMPVGIRPIPEDREAETPSNYDRPAADGSRAGWFNLQTYKPEEEVKFDKTALVLHETNPGHHLQIALQIETEDLPDFRKTFRATAYTEGWALYAESLGDEMGIYKDPYSRFGKLESERFRAKRLVVDTGLHAFGWTRKRAVDYLNDPAEIDRYIAWPGQALAYKIGEIKIQELRARAEKELGDQFDIRDFHDVILRNGALPLELLEQQVVDFIQSR